MGHLRGATCVFVTLEQGSKALALSREQVRGGVCPYSHIPHSKEKADWVGGLLSHSLAQMAGWA